MLYNKQFGFKRKHSTDHALLYLVNDVTDAFNRNFFTLGVFIDISKAFNTVDRKILVTKLQYCSVRDNNLS